MKKQILKLHPLGGVENARRIICSLPLGPEYTNVLVKGASLQSTVPLGKYGLFALQNPAVTAGFDADRVRAGYCFLRTFPAASLKRWRWN